MASALSMAIISTSCNKEDEKNNDLVGTTWVYLEDAGSAVVVMTLNFTTSEHFVFNANVIGDPYDIEITDQSFEGTYTYNPPTVTLTVSGKAGTGTVSGNTLTLVMIRTFEDGGEVHTEEEELVFIKSTAINYELTGTTWKYQDTHRDEEGETVSIESTLTFPSSTIFSMVTEWASEDEIESYHVSGPYTYAPPIVTLTAENETYAAIINGNTLTIDNGEGDLIVYTKQ
jgi:hypothetical protein